VLEERRVAQRFTPYGFRFGLKVNSKPICSEPHFACQACRISSARTSVLD
jgi:hypothetical protein